MSGAPAIEFDIFNGTRRLVRIHDPQRASAQAVGTFEKISISCLAYGVTDGADLPLAFRMEINTADRSLNLIETDVVEPLEASP